MVNYSVRKGISRALSRAGIPEPLKFFLFGVSRRRRHSQRENLQCNDSFAAVNNTDESDIAIAIDRWASINSNIIRGFSMRSIATGLGLDISEVKDYFNNVSVEGFTKWRNRIRVRLASDLILQDPDSSLESIGRKVGFTDKSNFYKQFRLYTGKTPGEWRIAKGQ